MEGMIILVPGLVLAVAMTLYGFRADKAAAEKRHNEQVTRKVA